MRFSVSPLALQEGCLTRQLREAHIVFARLFALFERARKGNYLPSGINGLRVIGSLSLVPQRRQGFRHFQRFRNMSFLAFAGKT
jgi:hypothetical protein